MTIVSHAINYQVNSLRLSLFFFQSQWVSLTTFLYLRNIFNKSQNCILFEVVINGGFLDFKVTKKFVCNLHLIIFDLLEAISSLMSSLNIKIAYSWKVVAIIARNISRNLIFRRFY